MTGSAERRTSLSIGQPPIMTRSLTFLFAVAGGAAVGNLYWSQPLLNFIASDLGAPQATSGWLVTATQVGYAAGVLLIVPLGDVVNRRRLVPAMMLCAAAALVLCAVAPTMGLLLAAITLLGLTTVGGQLLIPLAGDLADDARRGAVVGTVASGILTGILVSRTISGLVADTFGWRAIYLLAAVVDVALAVVLYRALPTLGANTQMSYPALFASIGIIIRRERMVRWILVLSAIAFALFTMFWTALTFLLSGPPFNYSVSVIGLISLVGLFGAVAAQRVGGLHDRGWSLPASGISWAVVVLAFFIAALGRSSVGLIIAAILLVTASIHAVNILNQTRLFEVSPDARSRLNTAFITNNFIGGAVGSTIATLLWSNGGWTAVSLTGAVLAGVALILWAIGRRGPLIDTNKELRPGGID